MTLQADIDRIVIATEERMLALARESLQHLIDDAQRPTAKGGRMRVDTGFLRASGQASLNGMPTGPVRGDSTDKHHYDNGEKVSPTVTLNLGELKLGSTLFFGWTANYAIYREAYDGFLEGATQNWQKIVNTVTDEIRERIKS